MEKTDVIAALSALAQETRLDIVRFLVRKGPEGAPAGAVGDHLGVPSATLAFHLSTLTEAKLLSRQRAGRQIIYRVNFGGLHGMVAYLLDNCCADAGGEIAQLAALSDDAA